MLKNLKFTLKAWPAITLVTVGLCFLTTWIAGLFGITLREQASLAVVRKYVGFNWPFIKILLMVLVAAPIGEELVFRLLLWKLPSSLINTLTREKFPRSCFMLHVSCFMFSAALFSAAHYLQMPFPDNAFISLFFFGLAQCWLYRRAGGWLGVVSPMLNHFLFNLTNLVCLLAVPESWLK